MSSIQMEAIRITTAQMTDDGLGKMFDKGIDPLHLREVVEVNQAAMPLQDGVTYVSCDMGGVESELSMPAYAREDAVIFYIHGGGLVCGNAYTSRGYAGMLAGESRIPVYACSYGLAPEHPFPEGMDDCVAVYKAILEKHPDVPVYLIGESGGALLSIATALKLRDEEDVQMPAGVIAYSPVMDFSGDLDRSWSGWDENTVTDDAIRGDLARFYCPDAAMRKDPLCSPHYADFIGFPPLYVVWDKGETLAPDAEDLIARATEARVPVEYARYEGTFHAFAPVGRNAPEGSKLLDDTIAFILRHLHDQKLDWEE